MGQPPQIPYPRQVPGFDLPGAEYFALAENRTIALQGRRRFFGLSSTVTAPATTNNTNATVTSTLETTFTNTSAVYIHEYFALISPNSVGLIVNTIFAGLSLRTAPFPDFPLGSPTLTAPNIFISTVLLSDRDRLITAKDILVLPLSVGIPTGQTLTLQTQVNVNNPEAVAISFTVQQIIVYTRLDGLLE